MGSNWEFVCFAKGYGKKKEVLDSDDNIDGSTDVWSEWKDVAAHKEWLMKEQRELLEAQERQAAMERRADKLGNWEHII